MYKILYPNSDSMNLETCKQKLKDTLIQNPTLKDSLSVLTTKAWAKDKPECYSAIGGLRGVQ